MACRVFIAAFICLITTLSAWPWWQSVQQISVVGSSASAAYTNFLARSTALDGTHQTRYQTLLDGLTTDGFFDGSGVSTKLDALYIFATQPDGTRANAKLNLVSSSFPLVEQGTVSFAPDVGYTGDGTTFWLNTQFTPNSGVHVYTTNSASYGVYNRTNAANGSTDMGSFSGVSSYLSISTNISYSINGGGTSLSPPAARNGFFGVVRTGASAVQLYQNSSPTPIGTNTDVAGGLDGIPINIFAYNSGGSPTNHQLAAAFIGVGLTGAEWALLATRVNNFMISAGASVY